MGNLFTKGASLILQIIFVVALVLVFAWYDPFDIFTPTKTTLKNTPVQVESIKQIGQLITAEYYGEVISSLQEVINEKDYQNAMQFDTVVNDLHEEFKEAVKEFSEEKVKGRSKKIYKAFVNEYSGLVNNEQFGSYLYFINEKLRGNQYNLKDPARELNPYYTRRLIKKLCTDKVWRNKLFALQTDEFKSITKKAKQEKLKKEFRHSRLVLIGRGWVKAGFDFRNFSNRNFRYDATRHRIHFIGMEPQILSATINPWFIPEEGVEGFEFLIAERGARFKPEYTNIVKQRCLDKLQQQALEKQILLKSKENAEQNLRSFFSLLLNDDVKGVYFHTNYLTYMSNVILQDSVISNEELLTIDTAIVYYYTNYDDQDKMETIATFIKNMHKHKATIYGETIHLNNYSSQLFTLFIDRVLDSLEIVNVINKQKAASLTDTLWSSELFSAGCFNTMGDTLDATQRMAIDSAYQAAQKNNRTDFCNDVTRLIHSFQIKADTIVKLNCR